MKKIIALIFGALFTICAQAQTDSIGVYLVRNNAVCRVEAINFNQTKISGGLKGKAK